jgi:hypothetical protein
MATGHRRRRLRHEAAAAPPMATPVLGRAWYNDIAAAALLSITRGTRFIIGDDWTPVRRHHLLGDRSRHEFFAAPRQPGGTNALRKFTPDEVGTRQPPDA